MLAIRFARVGKKNKAQFKIMLQERTLAPGGKHVEVLGSYDPHRKIAVLKEERIKYWIGKGALASDTVHNLLVRKGVISEKKRSVKIPRKVEEAKPEEMKTEEKLEDNTVETEKTKEVKKEDNKAEAVEEVKQEEAK
jgi:small subunit ribosomal protein S16